MTQSAAPVAEGEKILIVDDDAALRESLCEQLRVHEEFTAREADTGAAGLDAARPSVSMSFCWTSACRIWMAGRYAG